MNDKLNRDQDARGAKANEGSGAPHVGAQSARFIGAGGPVFAMVGTVLDRSKVSEGSPVHVLIAPGAIREYEAFFLPVFEFFKTPRDESQVQEWLAWADAPSDFLTTLIDTGAVVRVDAVDPLLAAESLRGIRVVAQSDPDTSKPPATNGLVEVVRTEPETARLDISVELAAALWGDHEQVDLPAVIEQIAITIGLEPRVAARKVLAEIPMLLRHGFARLEWMNAPGI